MTLALDRPVPADYDDRMNLRHPHWCLLNAPEPDDCADHVSARVLTPATGGEYAREIGMAVFPGIGVAAFLAEPRDWLNVEDNRLVQFELNWGTDMAPYLEARQHNAEADLSLAAAAELRAALVTGSSVTVIGVNGRPRAADIEIRTEPHPRGMALRLNVPQWPLVVLRPHEVATLVQGIDIAVAYLTGPTVFWTLAERDGGAMPATGNAVDEVEQVAVRLLQQAGEMRGAEAMDASVIADCLLGSFQRTIAAVSR